MDFLSTLVKLLTQPPGDLVYFLVVLFALQQAMAALLSVPPTARSKHHRRWMWALGVMLGGRLLLMVVALLGSVDLVTPNRVMPPVEHWVEAVSALLFFWAIVGEKQTRSFQTGILGVAIAAFSAFYLYDATRWLSLDIAGTAYNGTLNELIWEGMTTFILVAALLWTVLVRPRNWEWYLVILLFWVTGHAGQLGWPDVTLDFASWERVMALVWTPMIAVTLQRQSIESILHEVAMATHPLRTVSSPLERELFRLDVGVLQSLLNGISDARELEPALILASSRLATLLRADFCAIALSEEQPSGMMAMQLIAVHPPSGRLDLPQLTADRYHDLFLLLESNTAYLFTDRQASRWLPLFYQEIGIEGSGPLLALPMRVEGEQIGMVFLGNPLSQQVWDKGTIQLFRLIAALLATAINRVRQRGDALLTLQPAASNEEVAQLKDEAQALQNRIVELEREVRSREQEIKRLRDEIARRPQVHETELTFWKNELKELARDRDVLIRERDRLVGELARLKDRYETLREERDHLKQRLEKVYREVEQLRIHLRRLDHPMDTLVGLIILDAEGRVIMADAIARRLLGLPDEIKGKRFNELYRDPKWVATINELLSAVASRRRARMTLESNGTFIEAEMMTQLDASGIPNALTITLSAQEDMAEEREALLSLVSELRTPMTSIIGYTDLLLAEQVGILNAMQTQFLERVKANIERMGQMLDDLVEMVSPEAHQEVLEPEPVDLAHVVEEAIVGMAARFRERKVGVRMDIPEAIAPLRVDRDGLYQIIVRLLSNALLCSKEGSEIVVSARMQDVKQNGETQAQSFVRVAVTDTCGGIAPEDMPRVFRRFHRAQQPLIQGMGERGVGMAMVKALVEANGGRIWVESERGVGSTFTFILPAYRNVPATA